MGKPKRSKKFGHAAAPSKVPLDEQITQGRVAKSKGNFKVRLRAEEEMVSRIKLLRYRHFHIVHSLLQYVDAKSSQKILTAARQQQAEFNIEDDFGPPLASKQSSNPFGPRRQVNKLDSDNSDCEDEQPDVDEKDFFDDIKLSEEDARALEMFQNKLVQ